ncbi:MAG: hypothetical protein K2L10_09935 [Ruminococcus sp.]|nr:hypothetical protein [Ruminococcus sp.]
MSKYQIYLYDEQKEFLLKYIRERRSENIKILLISAVIFIYKFLLLNSDVALKNSFEIKCAVIYHNIIMVMSVFVFITTFISGFGKTFGYKCDKKCIENDWYTITSGNFVCRDKNSSNKHPYYISDKVYNQYICPRFLDWKNADEHTTFIYIKLENGRNYAIVDK